MVRLKLKITKNFHENAFGKILLKWLKNVHINIYFPNIHTFTVYTKITCIPQEGKGKGNSSLRVKKELNYIKFWMTILNAHEFVSSIALRD